MLCDEPGRDEGHILTYGLFVQRSSRPGPPHAPFRKRCVMRRLALVLMALNLLVLCALPSSAGDDKEVAAVIEKAIKAHFPKGFDATKEAVRIKSKGTLQTMGLKVEYTSVASMYAGKFMEAMYMDVMGKKVNVISGFNGKEGWVKAGDKDVKVTDDMLPEFKEAAFVASHVWQLIFTKDKAVKYALSGEVQVKGKPALGMVISREGKKDIKVFFDKNSGLIVKAETRKRDPMSGKETTEERFITEYQDLDGRKVAKKFELLHDGKEFLKAEVTDVQFLDKLDASEFAQPK
jgi:hypothetical protein